MMRHGEHAHRKADKPRVLWHPDAPPDVRQPPTLPEVKEASDQEAERKPKQRKPSPKRNRITKFKEPQPSDQELEIERAFEAKASWRTETWNRASLDTRLDVVKDMEVERYARRPKTPEEPTWKGVVEPPPGSSPLSKKMYEQIQDMVHIPVVERPVDMDRPKGQPFHGEELRKIRERDRARRKAAAAAAAAAADGTAAPAPTQTASPSPARSGRASASPTMVRRSPRTPVKKGRDRSGRPSPLVLSPPGTPQTPNGQAATESPLSPAGTPTPVSAKQRWAGARTKLKVAAVMGAQLKVKRQETTKLAARSRWKAGGLLAKQKAAQEKQAAQVVEDKVMTGAMAWKKKAALRKEQAAAEAVAAEQRAKNKAMFAAAVQGDAEVVRMALQEGAEVEARNAAGLTVTQLALERKRGAVVKVVATFQREELDKAVVALWTNYSAHLEEEGEGEIGGESPKAAAAARKKTGKQLWKKASELVDPNPIATAAAKAKGQQQQEKGQQDSPAAAAAGADALAVMQEGKTIQAALDRAAPILAQLESLESLLTSKASQEQSAAIVPEVLNAHKKKLSRIRKWKRKLEVAHRRKQEKEEAWAKELNSFRDAARSAEMKKLAREAEADRAERAVMEEAKAVEKKRLALEVAAQRRAVELAEVRLAAKQKEAARQQALQNLDGGNGGRGRTPATPGTPGSALSASSRRILLSPMQNQAKTQEKLASPLAAAKMRRIRRASITQVQLDQGPLQQA